MGRRNLLHGASMNRRSFISGLFAAAVLAPAVRLLGKDPEPVVRFSTDGGSTWQTAMPVGEIVTIRKPARFYPTLEQTCEMNLAIFKANHPELYGNTNA